MPARPPALQGGSSQRVTPNSHVHRERGCNPTLVTSAAWWSSNPVCRPRPWRCAWPPRTRPDPLRGHTDTTSTSSELWFRVRTSPPPGLADNFDAAADRPFAYALEPSPPPTRVRPHRPDREPTTGPPPAPRLQRRPDMKSLDARSPHPHARHPPARCRLRPRRALVFTGDTVFLRVPSLLMTPTSTMGRRLTPSPASRRPRLPRPRTGDHAGLPRHPSSVPARWTSARRRAWPRAGRARRRSRGRFATIRPWTRAWLHDATSRT